MAEVSRNIVLLSDGTGNSAGKLFKTNVWRIYDSLDLSNASQIASYDDGVGTSSVKPLAVLGGAFGWGLKRNVLALYMFLCRNYQDGDKICAFGFSRGAFTIRVLIKFVLSQGLIPTGQATSNDDLRRKALRLYRRFRVEQTQSWGLHTLARPLRDLLVWLKDLTTLEVRAMRDFKRESVKEIEFLGLWDTVDAYGLPVAELGKGVDRWIWPLSLNDKMLDPAIKKACHALSIDDTRTTFHPLLWDESGSAQAAHTDDERLTQVWFAGAHANVGGGYPDDALSFIPLRWMIGEAKKCKLRFNELALDAIDVKLSPYGRIYNPRAGLGAYYRYDPRRLDPPRDHQNACIPQPKIHESVIWRIAMGTDSYAPLSLPNELRVVTDHRPASNEGTKAKPNVLGFKEYCDEVRDEQSDLFGIAAGKAAAADRQKRVAEEFQHLTMPESRTLDLIWYTVWWRRVAYFATLIVTVWVALLPMLMDVNLDDAESNPIARVGGALATAALPGIARPWIEVFQTTPYGVLAVVSLAALLALWGSLLDRRIHDRALAAWNAKWRLQRSIWYRGSIRQRYMAGLLASIPFLLGLGLIAAGAASDSGTTLLGIVIVVLFVLPTLLVWVWMGVVWWANRNGQSGMEGAGPALIFACVMRKPTVVAAYRVWANHILPAVFAAGLVLATVVAASRVAFDFMDSGGWVCTGGGSEKLQTSKEVTLKIDNGCQAAGVALEKDVKYQLELTRSADKWRDHRGVAVASGSSTWAVGWAKYLDLPLRRKLTSSWFDVIARVRGEGNEEYVLTPGTPKEITPRHNGPLFLYINEAVVGWSDYDRWYKRDKGEATVTIRRVGMPQPPIAPPPATK